MDRVRGQSHPTFVEAGSAQQDGLQTGRPAGFHEQKRRTYLHRLSPRNFENGYGVRLHYSRLVGRVEPGTTRFLWHVTRVLKSTLAACSLLYSLQKESEHHVSAQYTYDRSGFVLLLVFAVRVSLLLWLGLSGRETTQDLDHPTKSCFSSANLRKEAPRNLLLLKKKQEQRWSFVCKQHVVDNVLVRRFSLGESRGNAPSHLVVRTCRFDRARTRTHLNNTPAPFFPPIRSAAGEHGVQKDGPREREAAQAGRDRCLQPPPRREGKAQEVRHQSRHARLQEAADRREEETEGTLHIFVCVGALVCLEGC